MEKTFKGKAIYNPSGKAGEYSYWACNFYTGCSNDCDYCYCKNGFMGKNWSKVPQLKKYFKNEEDALLTFQRELHLNSYALQEHGIFFSFTTDPMLPETIALTKAAVKICFINKVPVKILTKNTQWVYRLDDIFKDNFKMVAFGFTLTGHDDLEPNASSSFKRIDAMGMLNEAGFKTFASIEPIIDCKSSIEMIRETIGYCDLYKIGVLSGKKYQPRELFDFVCEVQLLVGNTAKIYFKDSLLKQAGIVRSELAENCVGRDYNVSNDLPNPSKGGAKKYNDDYEGVLPGYLWED